MDHSTAQTVQPHSLEEAKLLATGLLGKAFDAYRHNNPQEGLKFEKQAYVKLGREYPGEFCEILGWYMYRLVTLTGIAGLPTALSAIRRLRNLDPFSYSWVKQLAFREVELSSAAQDRVQHDDALATFLRLNTPGSPVPKVLDDQTRQLLGDDVRCCRMRLRRAVMIAVVGTNFIDEATRLMGDAQQLLHGTPRTLTHDTAIVECTLTSALIRLKSGDGSADSFFAQVQAWSNTNATDGYFQTFFTDVNHFFKQHVAVLKPEDSASEEPVVIPSQATPSPLPVRPKSTALTDA